MAVAALPFYSQVVAEAWGGSFCVLVSGYETVAHRASRTKFRAEATLLAFGLVGVSGSWGGRSGQSGGMAQRVIGGLLSSIVSIRTAFLV